MSTVTDQLTDRNFVFISSNPDKLVRALRLVFGDPEPPTICWTINEEGFHLAVDSNDGYTFYSGTRWYADDRPWDDLSSIASDINTWLAGLSYEEARKMCQSTPSTEDYMADPDLDPKGYRVLLRRTRDGVHFIVTVTPDRA